MKYELLIQILFLLLSKKQVSARELADRFEISTRTVYRYVECLELAYVPVLRKNGRGGGFSIPDSYRIPSAFFTDKELSALKNALSALQHDVDLPELATAEQKLNAVSRRKDPERQFFAGNMVIDGSAWGENEGHRAKLSLLGRATEEKRKVELSYHDRTGEFSKRKIHPYALILKQGVWYVFAYCELRADFRLFRVGRIAYLSLTEDGFLRREEVAPPTLDFDFLHAEKVEILLKVAPKALARAEDFFGVESMEERRDGVYFRASLPDDDLLVGEILQFGDGVEVISPASLREKVQKSALSIAERYGN